MTQKLTDWLASHVRALEFFGGVPELLIPDNLASGVVRAHRYDPEINPSYAELATHYDTAIMPARPRAPRDKSKAELGVLLVERWILARLRHRCFYNLGELNGAITELLEDLNARPFQRGAGETRRGLFERIERDALKPLPRHAYRVGFWYRAKVAPDYHIQVQRHRYSVPSELVGKTLEARVRDQVLEVFHDGRRVATHTRGQQSGGTTTHPDHMPKRHRRHREWSPGQMRRWADRLGPATRALTDCELERRPHREHSYRAFLGLRHLARCYGCVRLEAACQRAIDIDALRLKQVESILGNGLDRVPAQAEQPVSLNPGTHANVRGSAYFAERLRNVREVSDG